MGVLDQIPRCVDRRIAGLHEFIDEQSTGIAQRQTGLDGQLGSRAHPNSQDHQIGREGLASRKYSSNDLVTLLLEFQNALAGHRVNRFFAKGVASHVREDRIEPIENSGRSLDQIDLNPYSVQLLDHFDPHETGPDDQGSRYLGLFDPLQDAVHIRQCPELKHVAGSSLSKRGQNRLSPHR